MLGRIAILRNKCMALHAATSRVENSAQGSSCQLKFVHVHIHVALPKEAKASTVVTVIIAVVIALKTMTMETRLKGFLVVLFNGKKFYVTGLWKGR
jgi:hypothetical protein